MAEHHAPSSLQVPLLSLPRFVLQRAATAPDQPALTDGLTGSSIRYGELALSASRAAAGLATRGFVKGDVLAIWSPNLPEYAVAALGAGLAGGIVTTINPLCNATELAHQLRDSGARALVTGPQFAAKAAEAARSAGVRDLFVFGEATGFEPFAALAGSARTFDPVEVDPREDVAALLYSGSTTGLPKGVMLTHFNLVANLVQMQAVERMAADEVVIGVVPFHHIYGFNVVLNLTLHAGATLVVLPRFDVEEFLRAVQDHSVTTAFVVPPIVRALAHHPLVEQYDLGSLRYIMSAAAPLPEEEARVCSRRLGCVLKQAYGLTETGPTTHWTPRDAVRLNSAGPPVPGTECRVIDVATRRDVPIGELGEIWVHGPQVMKGYLNNPEVTRRVLDDDGWLRTGDIGYSDADGYIYVLDRATDLVKFRGLQYRDGELLLSVVEDRTRQREDQRRLRFQSLLLDSVRESIVGIDAGHAVTYWNNGAQALFGYTAEEALGRPIDQLILLEDERALADWQDEMAELTSLGEWQGQVRRRRKDGSVIWTDVVASVVKSSEGHRSGFIAIHRDRTELRRSQEMLRESHERLQHLAAGLIDVREQERSAIARELHDELGQALTRLNMDLVWIVERLPRRLHTKRSAGMVSLVEEMLTTVQHLCAQLRPAILDDFGLEAAIEWQAQEFEQWQGARCHVDLRLPPLLPDRDRDTTVFRILQESLTNVARHARAESVHIRCGVTAGDLVLEVVDDGVGIADGTAGGPRSLGVLGMRERARAIGAELEISPALPRGTAVRFRVPVGLGEPHPMAPAGAHE
jgi:PAS domain S-box-containing protein